MRLEIELKALKYFSCLLPAFDKFYSPIPYSKIWVMSTYYIAQFAIAISVLDHEVMTKKSAKSN